MNWLMMSFACFFALFLSPLALSDVSNLLNENASAWELSETHNKTKIYTRPYDNSNFDAFKAVAIINQPIESVFAVISDPTSCPLWVDNCLDSYNLTTDNPNTNQFNNRYGYALSHLPWPFKNRDLIVHIITSNKPDTKEITIAMFNDEQKSSKAKNVVHIMDTETLYILRPIKSDQTELVWMQHTEPAGKLPAWLVNSMIISLPLKSIDALEKTAGLEKYQNAVIKFDSQKHIQGLELAP